MMAANKVVRWRAWGMLAILAWVCVAAPDAARATHPHLVCEMPCPIPDREDLAPSVRSVHLLQQGHPGPSLEAASAGVKVRGLEFSSRGARPTHTVAAQHSFASSM